MAEEGLGEYLNLLLRIPKFKHCNKLGQRARACFCSAVIIFFFRPPYSQTEEACLVNIINMMSRVK